MLLVTATPGTFDQVPDVRSVVNCNWYVSPATEGMPMARSLPAIWTAEIQFAP